MPEAGVARAAACAAILALPLAADAADTAPLTPEIVVTAARAPAPSLTLVGNNARIDADSLRLLGETHANEMGYQAAGTWLSRGTEQESLPAIRSPVLTGPGSCGAFLMLEDGFPVRPAGFCNVNELFEVLTEQATAMEVVRGPSSTLYGANGLHGTLNFLLPAPGEAPGFGASAEMGPHDYWRGTTAWDGVAAGDPLAAGLLVAHDGDFRDSAGYRQAKGYAKLDHDTAAGQLQVGFAATVLDQDTAGYITGYKAYADRALRSENLFPDAYRDADSERLYLRWTPAAETALAGTDLRAVLRHSRMDFLQHFLPGTPKEKNGQWSAAAMASRADPLGRGTLRSGLDVEVATGFVNETQEADSGIGTIPAGTHYDYDVTSYMAGAFGQVSWPLGERWSAVAGLRAEYLLYDYDNAILDGNTRDDGTPCTPAPCRYYRPPDRQDGFINLAPSLGLLYRVRADLTAYANLARGFRPPQAAELYRLQAQQSVTDLKSETLDSAEIGMHWQTGISRVEMAAFYMTKRHYIFQDSSRLNLGNGETRHRGVELQASVRLPSGLYGAIAATYARQTYAFNATTPGGDVIVSGNDIDTAPRTLGSARVGVERGSTTVELEWVHVGDYYLDAANLTTYAGHDVLNLRGAWRITPRWTLMARLNNLADKLYADRADFVSIPSPAYRYFPGRDREVYVEVAYHRP